MKPFSHYLDIHSFLDGYDKYDDVDFDGCSGNDILLRCLNVSQDEPRYEAVKITQAEYEKALVQC